MEKKELRERLSDLKLLEGVYGFKFDDLIDFILEGLDKAREEGRKEGVDQMGYWIRDNIKTVEQEDIDEAKEEILKFLSKLTTK